MVSFVYISLENSFNEVAVRISQSSRPVMYLRLPPNYSDWHSGVEQPGVFVEFASKDADADGP